MEYPLHRLMKLRFQLNFVFQAVPLDMSQFPGLFNATRIPQKTKDTIARDPDARHMLVMKNGHFFVFDVFDRDGQ